MQCGVLYSDKGVFVAGDEGKFDVPVPYFLIAHEKGYVLFDSGHNRTTVKNPKSLPQDIINGFCPGEIGDGYVLDSLKKVGVKPEEIVYHICSHLHFDHAGGIGLFPNATYVVQRQELHYAFVPDPFIKVVYLRKDFDKDVNWLFLDGKDKYDLFDDGKIIIYYTPGHTPGHQSVLVNLEKEGPYLLTQDACFTTENLDGLKLPGTVCNASAYINTLRIFQDLQKRGVKIIPGHDPNVWRSLKKSPEFYE
jgi:glyoxylase-like metal-dependent hydrolase (beta-lactamase superfamily II)